MGILLDSTVLIGAERSGSNARKLIQVVRSIYPEEDVTISVVTLTELMHGVVRADSPRRQSLRRSFLDDLLTVLSVQPVTADIALRAGQLDGENAAKGICLAFADLLIGSTALELGYRLATGNLRHFRMIPGLELVIF